MTRSSARAVVVAAALAAATACTSAAPDGVPSEPPSIRGQITHLSSGTDRMTIRVEERPEDTSGSHKASVTVTAATRVLERSGTELRPSTSDRLTTGRVVTVWFTGPVRESYPVQADAAVVVIEAAAPAGG